MAGPTPSAELSRGWGARRQMGPSVILTRHAAHPSDLLTDGPTASDSFTFSRIVAEPWATSPTLVRVAWTQSHSLSGGPTVSSPITPNPATHLNQITTGKPKSSHRSSPATHGHNHFPESWASARCRLVHPSMRISPSRRP